MTARPRDPACRRCPLIVAVALVLLLGMVMAAGCAWQQLYSGNLTTNSTAIDNSSTLITKVVQTLGPASGNDAPWILINPISNHVIGDVFEINGTTNLGIDEKIQIAIYGRPVPVPYPGVPAPSKGSYGLCTVKKGDRGINFWSYSVNTSEFNNPDYFVRVGTENWTVDNATLFSVTMW